MGTLAPRRRSTTVAALATVVPLGLFAAWLVLAPDRVEVRLPALYDTVQSWVARTWGEEWATILVLNAVANALLFVPVGILAYLLIPRRAWYLSLLVAPLACALSELAQVMYLPERVPDPYDVVAAAVGGTIGVVIAGTCTLIAAWPRRRRPRSRSAATAPAAELADAAEPVGVVR